MTLDWIIIIISSLAVLMPFSLALRQFNVLSEPLRIIFYYILIALMFEILGWITVLLHQQNHWVTNIFNILEFIFISFYFLKIFKIKKIYKVLNFLILLVAISIILLTLIDYRNINHYNSIAFVISCFALMMLVLYHFYILLYSLEVPRLTTNPYFWISSGVLLYFSGSFFINLFSEFILFNEVHSINQLWHIQHIILFIFRIFLAIGLWFSKTPIQSNLSSK
jgi:hypothetical protein